MTIDDMKKLLGLSPDAIAKAVGLLKPDDLVDIANLVENAFSQRDDAIARIDKYDGEKAQLIADQAKALADAKTAADAAQAAAVDPLGVQIAELQASIGTLKGLLEVSQKAIDAGIALVGERDKTITEKDAKIAELEAAGGSADVTIVSLTATLVDANEHIKTLTTKLEAVESTDEGKAKRLADAIAARDAAQTALIRDQEDIIADQAEIERQQKIIDSLT